MPAILTSNASVIAAENFVSSIQENDSNLYLGVGRGYDDQEMTTTPNGPSTPTDGHYDDYNRWHDEYTPPTPRDTQNDVKNFLANLIGIKKIMPSNIMLVVPRNDWAPGKVYFPLNPAAVAGKRAQNYYCLTSDERGNNNVWVCIGKSDSAAGSTVEPSLAYRETTHETTSHNIGYHYVANNTVKTGDGYEWLFLYNITSTMINAGLLLENWMPVPYNHHGVFGGTITETQQLYGDTNANRTLGAYRVLVTCTLGDEGDAIPYSCIYRQIGLLMDPRAKEGGNAKDSNTSGSYTYNNETPNTTADDSTTSSSFPVMGPRLTGEKYPASAVDCQNGTTPENIANPVQVIFLENKKAVMREESQSEKLVMILVF